MGLRRHSRVLSYAIVAIYPCNYIKELTQMEILHKLCAQGLESPLKFNSAPQLGLNGLP
jgi:hypothetical protein